MDLLENFLNTFEKATKFDNSVVFIVTKSDNKNIVAYSSKLEDNIFPKKSPIKKCWQTWEEQIEDKDPPIHQLTKIEKTLGYGVCYTKTTERQLDITINAYKKLPITLQIIDEQIKARLEFGGMNYFLMGIYVHINNNNSVKDKINPKGITLIVKLPLSEDCLELSPPFPIYIDSKSKID